MLQSTEMDFRVYMALASEVVGLTQTFCIIIL